MFKRIMSVMLAIVMLMSVAMVATSAAQVEIADNSADAVAGVAADGAADTGADAGAETAASHTFSFDVNSTNWQNFKKIYCYIWEYGTDNKLTNWQEKKNQCTDPEKDGIWTLDLDAKGLSISDGVLYCVIFSNENGMQTYDLLLDSTCYGDVAYCNGESFENPADSSKTSYAAVWKGKDPSVLGPVKCITSIGNVVGSCIPRTVSAMSMFESFLKDTLTNARQYSGKDDQKLLDDTAAALGLQQENVKEAITNTGVEVAWSADKSSLPAGKNEEANKTPAGGTTDPGSTGGGSGSTGGGSGSTGGGSGSGSNTKTGQETTVLFIMLGLMIAAAGAVVLSRKSRA